MREQLKQIIPEHLWPMTYIAGGYVASPELANDVDVWILAQWTPEMIAGAVTDVCDRLGLDPTMHYDAPEYEDKQFTFAGDGVVEVTEGDGVRSYKLQVFVTPHKSISELLETFDVSVHQRAMDLEGVEYACFTTTNIDQQPVVTALATPRRTEERLIRLCRRYGYEPLPEDITELWRLQGFLPEQMAMEVPW